MGRENRFKNLQTRLNEQTNLCKLETKRFKIILTFVSRAYHVDYKLHVPQNKPKVAKIGKNVSQHNVTHGSSYPQAQSSLSLHLLFANSPSSPTKGQLLHN